MVPSARNHEWHPARALPSDTGGLPTEKGDLLTDPGVLYSSRGTLYYSLQTGPFHMFCSMPASRATLDVLAETQQVDRLGNPWGLLG